MSVTVERTVAELDPLSTVPLLPSDGSVANTVPEGAAPAAVAASPPVLEPICIPSNVKIDKQERDRDPPKGAAPSSQATSIRSSVSLMSGSSSSLSSASSSFRSSEASGHVSAAAEGVASSGDLDICLHRADSAVGTLAPHPTDSTKANPKSQSFAAEPKTSHHAPFSLPSHTTTTNCYEDVSFACAVPSTSTKTDERGKMFTVYNIKLSALDTRWVVSKRFSELEYLNDALRRRFPNARLPKFPSKGGLGGLFRRLDDVTIEKRRADLQTYLDGALSNHNVYKSMLLRMFFEIPRGIEKANREAAEQAAMRAAVKPNRVVTTNMGVGYSDGRGSVVRSESGLGPFGTSGNDSLGNLSGAGERNGFGGSDGVSRRGACGIDSARKASAHSVLLFANQKRQHSKVVVRADFDSIRQAIKDGELDTVQKILTMNDRLGRYVDPSGQSMLHLACMFSHTDIAMALVEVGADPGLANSHGETAYDLAPPALAQRMAAYVDSWQDSDSSDSSDPENMYDISEGQ